MWTPVTGGNNRKTQADQSPVWIFRCIFNVKNRPCNVRMDSRMEQVCDHLQLFLLLDSHVDVIFIEIYNWKLSFHFRFSNIYIDEDEFMNWERM